MKRVLTGLLAMTLLVLLASCGSGTSRKGDGSIDVDLTKLSSTMVYSEVYAMLTSPDDYVGKSVKMSGDFALYMSIDDAGVVDPSKVYLACVIADATACCQQGLEFVLAGNINPLTSYPELGSNITVVGEFQTYMEGPDKYCHLVNARFV